MTTVPSPVALVTGASRGIGYAIAAALLAAGGRVAITGRDAGSLDEAAASLGTAERVLPIPGNSASPEHRADAVAAVLERFGRLDALVNNTGINPAYGALIEIDLGAVRKLLDTNIVGTLGWVQEAHRAWMGAHGGAIVNVASVAGLRPAAGIGAYGASKAAVVQLTRQLALELAPGVRVNAVAPAVVQTRFASALYADREAEVAAGYPLGRLGVPEDIAGAVAFLLSPEASWISGETLVVDGGLMATGGI